MHNKITTKNDNLRIIFFAYSLSLMELILCQPFNEYFRFIIYCTIPILAIYVICKNGFNSIIINTASVIILATELLTGIMLFINKEVMVYGLASLINLLLFVVGFYAVSSDNLLHETYRVTKVLTVVTLFICLISYLIRPFMLTFPQLNDLYIWGHKFCFSGIANTNYRWNGYARHPNQTGMICAAGIISSFIFFMLAKSKKEIALAIINIMLNGIFLFLVSSRSPLLASISFVVTFLIYYLIAGGFKKAPQITRRLIILISIALLFLCCLAIVFIASPSFRDYLLNKIIRVDNIKTATGRTQLQETILSEFFAKKSFLKGLSNTYINDITDGFGPHNAFIQVLASVGFPGFILLCLSIVIPLIYTIRLLLKRNTLTESELLLSAIAFGSIIAMIIQNSFEVAYIYQLLGSSGLERWLLCFSVILWHNKKQEKELSTTV